MKLLYAARLARFDLLRPINALARHVTKWSKEDDKRLHHLMCYVNWSKGKKMIGWVGDSLDRIHVAMYADADFAGCADSQRSTSGCHVNLQGKHTRFPLVGNSKRQGCVSHSTPEAEIVAADATVKNHGLPCAVFWEGVMQSQPNVIFYEDNQTMISVARTGKNPTMRHIKRTHGISIAWLHEMFQRKEYALVYELSSKMAADIYTKAFIRWKHACILVNLFDKGDLDDPATLEALAPSHDAESGTRQAYGQMVGNVPAFPYSLPSWDDFKSRAT